MSQAWLRFTIHDSRATICERRRTKPGGRGVALSHGGPDNHQTTLTPFPPGFVQGAPRFVRRNHPVHGRVGRVPVWSAAIPPVKF